MSASVQATELLRPGLLEGAGLVVVGFGADPGFGSDAAQACAALGARVTSCVAPEGEDAQDTERLVGEAVSAALAECAGAGALLVDGASLFAGPEPLQACMLACWTAVRAFVAPAGADVRPGARIVLLAPREDAGPQASAVAAALENLARTLSIEWARHGVTTVAVHPGAATSSGEVAAIVAYLLSQAGSYFSGCVLDLRGI